MTSKHLRDLEKALLKHRWYILDRFHGQDYQNPAKWVIVRADAKVAYRIEFECNQDLDEQTVEHSMGCCVERIPSASLYFSRGRSWPDLLNSFINALESGETSAESRSSPANSPNLFR